MPVVEALIEDSIEIAASPTVVWTLVSDLRNMPRWSPQCAKTWIRGGGRVQLGTRTLNLNRRGLLVWPTKAKVVRFEEGREIAFRVKDNFTIWSFTLEDTGAGTRLVERREAPDGVSDISDKLTRAVLGGHDAFADELRAGIRRTLERIRDEAERST